jgi:tellurium resistance protein TerD
MNTVNITTSPTVAPQIDKLELQVSWTLSQQADLDISCVLYGKMGSLLDCAFFNNKNVENGAIIHQGDSKIDVEGVDESITINLAQLNAGVKALAFVVNCSNTTFAVVQAIKLAFIAREQNMSYIIEDPDCTSNDKGYIVCILHRPNDNDPSYWKITPVKKKANNGKSFQECLPELRNILRDFDIIDPILLDETSTQKIKSFDLQKGEFFELPDVDALSFCLGWDAGTDLDASVAFFDIHNDELLQSPVYFGQKTAYNQAIYHHGDNLTGAGEGDDEVIDIYLNRLPAKVHSLFVLVNAYRNDFSVVKNAFVRLVDLQTKRQICKYLLDNVEGRATGYLMCRIYRHKGIIDNSISWRIQALGIAKTGNTAHATVREILRERITKDVPYTRLQHTVHVTQGKDLIAKGTY